MAYYNSNKRGNESPTPSSPAPKRQASYSGDYRGIEPRHATYRPPYDERRLHTRDHHHEDSHLPRRPPSPRPPVRNGSLPAPQVRMHTSTSPAASPMPQTSASSSKSPQDIVKGLSHLVDCAKRSFVAFQSYRLARDELDLPRYQTLPGTDDGYARHIAAARGNVQKRLALAEQERIDAEKAMSESLHKLAAAIGDQRSTSSDTAKIALLEQKLEACMQKLEEHDRSLEDRVSHDQTLDSLNAQHGSRLDQAFKEIENLKAMIHSVEGEVSNVSNVARKQTLDLRNHVEAKFKLEEEAKKAQISDLELLKTSVDQRAAADDERAASQEGLMEALEDKLNMLKQPIIEVLAELRGKSSASDIISDALETRLANMESQTASQSDILDRLRKGMLDGAEDSKKQLEERLAKSESEVKKHYQSQLEDKLKSIHNAMNAHGATLQDRIQSMQIDLTDATKKLQTGTRLDKLEKAWTDLRKIVTSDEQRRVVEAGPSLTAAHITELRQGLDSVRSGLDIQVAATAQLRQQQQRPAAAPAPTVDARVAALEGAMRHLQDRYDNVTTEELVAAMARVLDAHHGFAAFKQQVGAMHRALQSQSQRQEEANHELNGQGAALRGVCTAVSAMRSAVVATAAPDDQALRALLAALRDPSQPPAPSR